MDCKRISELIPWLINGSLPEAEKSLVGAHLADCANCRKAVDETKFLLQTAKIHIPVEVLLDFAETKTVKNFDTKLFENHLAACNECSEQLLLSTESFESLEDAEMVIPPLENPAPNWISNIFQSVKMWRFAAVSALALLLLTLGGLLYILQMQKNSEMAYLEQQKDLQEKIKTLETEKQEQSNQFSNSQTQSNQTIEDLKNKVSETENKLKESESQKRETPNIIQQTPPNISPKNETPKPQGQANVVALDVFPTSIYRSESANENQLNIPRNANSATLILNLASTAQFPRYSIELINANGAKVWQNNNLKRYSANDFTINLPAHLLQNGGYIINIYGIENGKRTKTESYQIKINRETR
jgi:hypothetical protein